MGLFGESKQEIIQKYEGSIAVLRNIIKSKDDEIRKLKIELNLEDDINEEDINKKLDNSFVLQAGRYIGGKTVPVGTYDLLIVFGTGIVKTNKPQEIFLRLESDPKARIENNWANCYAGMVIENDTIVEISETAKIKFTMLS